MNGVDREGINADWLADAMTGGLSMGINPDKAKAETSDLHKRALMTFEQPGAMQKLAEATSIMVQEAITSRRNKGERLTEDAVFERGLEPIFDGMKNAKGEFTIALNDGTSKTFANFKEYIKVTCFC